MRSFLKVSNGMGINKGVFSSRHVGALYGHASWLDTYIWVVYGQEWAPKRQVIWWWEWTMCSKCRHTNYRSIVNTIGRVHAIVERESECSISPPIIQEIEGEGESQSLHYTTLHYQSIISLTHTNKHSNNYRGSYYISSIPCFSIMFPLLS